MRKNRSGFFILFKYRLLASILVLAVSVLAGGASLLSTGSDAKLVAAPSEQLVVFAPTFSASVTPAVTPPLSHAAVPTPPPEPPELVGETGYALSGGNCVNEPGVNNPGYGNPADWPVISQTPWIGATAVFNYNHVGVVTGIWRNGDIEVRHQNYYGEQHRFAPGEFRGFR
jgi:hypothetical protein